MAAIVGDPDGFGVGPEEQGADAVVLAGTDLNLAFDGSVEPGYPVIDALDVHVGVLADLALDRRTLEGVPAVMPR